MIKESCSEALEEEAVDAQFLEVSKDGLNGPLHSQV